MGEMQALEYHTRFEERDGYLEARASGRFSLPATLAFIDRLAQELGGRPDARALIDMTAVASHATDIERYEYALYAVKKLAAIGRLAVLAAPHQNVNRMFEDTAHNRGLPVRVFLSRDQALTWLTE